MLKRICTWHFDEFEEAMAGIRGRHVLVERARSLWQLDVLALGDVALMDGRNGARSVYQGACDAETCIVFVPIESRRGLSLNGRDLEGGGLGIAPSGRENRVPSDSGLRWLTVSIRPHAFPHLWDGGKPLLSPDVAFRAGAVDPRAQERLASLVLDAFRVAIDAPGTFEDPTTRRVLQDQIVDAAEGAVSALGAPVDEHGGRPRIDRARVLDVALQCIRENADAPLRISDLCAQTGVSAATLRATFDEQLRLSPHRYLMLYRMHAIRRALLHARAGETIASVCGRFGVWEFGRFATQYRRQFGVTPVQTLRSGRG